VVEAVVDKDIRRRNSLNKPVGNTFLLAPFLAKDE
jgi:hypothetical protein